MCVVAPISTIHVFGFEEDKEKVVSTTCLLVVLVDEVG